MLGDCNYVDIFINFYIFKNYVSFRDLTAFYIGNTVLIYWCLTGRVVIIGALGFFLNPLFVMFSDLVPI